MVRNILEMKLGVAGVPRFDVGMEQPDDEHGSGPLLVRQKGPPATATRFGWRELRLRNAPAAIEWMNVAQRGTGIFWLESGMLSGMAPDGSEYVWHEDSWIEVSREEAT